MSCRVEKRIEIKVTVVSISDKVVNEAVLMGRQKRLGGDNYFLVWRLHMERSFSQCFHICLAYIIYIIFYIPSKKYLFNGNKH